MHVVCAVCTLVLLYITHVRRNITVSECQIEELIKQKNILIKKEKRKGKIKARG